MDNFPVGQPSIPEEPVVMPQDGGSSSAPSTPTSPSTPRKIPGKVIATLFGILFLIGAVSAGLVLVNQRQLINQKAAACADICSDLGSCNLRGGSWSASSGSNHPECAPQGGFCSGGNNCADGGGGGSGSNWNISGNCINVTSGTVQVQRFDGPSCPTTQNAHAPETVGVGSWCTTPSEGSCQQIDVVGSGNGTCSCLASNPTPTPTPVPQCGSSCNGPADCASGLTCSAGVCKNPSCTSATDCICATSTPTPTSTPTTPGVSAICTNLRAFDQSFNQLTDSQLSNLTAGSIVRFAVNGTTSGTFDQARFTINGSLQPPTSLQTTLSTQQLFYMNYTIPAGVTTFTIEAELHEVQTGAWY